jgi:tripartite-type tricarboxylate transporter receptor subunit TctC
MTTSRPTVLTQLLLASAAALVALGVNAAEFPARPINLMVAFPAGGSTDVGARIVAALAEKELGQQVIVVNKGGAGGQVGWTDLSRQKPDGYNIGFVNLPALNTVILDPDRKAIFGIDHFVPLINQVLDPGVIWVKADSPYRDVKGLIEAAKRTPNKISAATTGILSDDHLAILMVEEVNQGAIFRIVHLDGGARQMTGILGGHLDVAFDNVGSIVKRVQSGDVRGLAVMDTQRSRFLPNVPTTPELGMPSVISNSTRGIAAPRGTPPEIVRRLQEGLRRAMENPEHVKKMEETGLALKVMVGEEYETYYRETHKKAAKYTEWARTRPHK